jgi:hypothetical protein
MFACAHRRDALVAVGLLEPRVVPVGLEPVAGASQDPQRLLVHDHACPKPATRAPRIARECVSLPLESTATFALAVACVACAFVHTETCMNLHIRSNMCVCKCMRECIIFQVPSAEMGHCASALVRPRLRQ